MVIGSGQSSIDAEDRGFITAKTPDCSLKTIFFQPVHIWLSVGDHRIQHESFLLHDRDSDAAATILFVFDKRMCNRKLHCRAVQTHQPLHKVAQESQNCV